MLAKKNKTIESGGKKLQKERKLLIKGTANDYCQNADN